MSLSKMDIKEKILCYFKSLEDNPQFTGFSEFIKTKNLPLEIRLETYYQILDVDQFSGDSDSLFFMYNNSIYLSKESLRVDFQRSSTAYSSKEKAEILYETHSKLNFLYSFGTLEKLKNLLQDINDYLEIDWATNYSMTKTEIDKMIGEGPFEWNNILYVNLLFYYDSSLLFIIPGNRYFADIEEENKRFTESYFISLLRASTDLINLKELECYQRFSIKTQKFIDAGNLLLDVYYSKTPDDLLDYSPLLLDFIKALESEVKDFYDNHYSYIIPQAELIGANRELLRQKKFNKGRIEYLILIAKNILSFKRNYQPSGIKPLAYFFYYFGLGAELDKHIQFEGFFSLAQREKIIKDISVIDRLFISMEKRNEFIHDKMVESKNEFLMLYSDIVLTFQLIGSLK